MLTYGYDGMDRLTSYGTPTDTQGYSYDEAGNRLTHTVGSNTYSYAYSAGSNRLSSITGPTAKSFTYDEAGNSTVGGTRTSVYDDRGRMTQATVRVPEHRAFQCLE